MRVAATTVNMHDLWALRGVGVKPDTFPRILGCDIVGWDADGNEVMVTGAFADPDAGGGDETFDPRRSLVSEELPGSFAEYTVVPARNVIAKPARLTFREAACLNVGWSTTYRALFTRGQAKPGERVLVQGAGGGVATAAIAMARAAGLYVIVASRSEDKRARARALGAHEVVPRASVCVNRWIWWWKPSVPHVDAQPSFGTPRRPRGHERGHHRFGHCARFAARFLQPGVDHRIDVRNTSRDVAHASFHGSGQPEAGHRFRLSARARS